MTGPLSWLVTREAIEAAEGHADPRAVLEAAAPLIAARVLREVADDPRHRWPPWVALALTAEADRIANPQETL